MKLRLRDVLHIRVGEEAVSVVLVEPLEGRSHFSYETFNLENDPDIQFLVLSLHERNRNVDEQSLALVIQPTDTDLSKYRGQVFVRRKERLTEVTEGFRPRLVFPGKVSGSGWAGDFRNLIREIIRPETLEEAILSARPHASEILISFVKDGVHFQLEFDRGENITLALLDEPTEERKASLRHFAEMLLEAALQLREG